MPALKVLFVAMKVQQGWKRIPPEQRRAILAAAQRSARKHGPLVAKTVKDQGPTVAKQLGRALRDARKRPSSGG
jgi:TRAP-type C4-dicarboxylate transport system substrate-binding protein